MRYQSKISLEENDVNTDVSGNENPFLDGLNQENEEPVVIVSGVDDNDMLTEDTSLTPEAIEATVLGEAAEVNEVAERVGDVTEAVTGLESIYLQLEKINQLDGTVSAESHGFLTIAYNTATRKFPALNKGDVIPSMESFAMSTHRASTVSLETIGQKIKNGYEAIVKFIKDLIERIKAFFGHIVSAGEVIKNKARKLLDRLKTVNDNAKSTKDITMPGVLNNPTLTGPGIKSLMMAVSSIGVVSYREVLRIMERSTSGDQNIALGEVMIAMHKAFDAYGKLADDTYLGNLSFKNDNFPPDIKLLNADSRQVPAYTKAKIKEYLEANITLGGAIGELKKSQTERAGALANLTSSIDRVSKRVDKMREEGRTTSESDKITGREILEMLRNIVIFIRKLISFENKLLARAIQVGNAINNSCAASIASLEGHDK